MQCFQGTKGHSSLNLGLLLAERLSDHIALSSCIPVLVFHFVQFKGEVTISTGGLSES